MKSNIFIRYAACFLFLLSTFACQSSQNTQTNNPNTTNSPNSSNSPNVSNNSNIPLISNNSNSPNISNNTNIQGNSKNTNTAVTTKTPVQLTKELVEESIKKSGITLEAYNKIKNDMTYKQVVGILGKEGELSKEKVGSSE